MLLATLDGSAAPLLSESKPSLVEIHGVVIDDTTVVVTTDLLDATEDVMMGKFRSDRGRVMGVVMVEVDAVVVPGRGKWGKLSVGATKGEADGGL